MKVNEAKEQLAELEAKLVAHQIKSTEHEAEIAAVSLPAQTGDASARKRLDKLVAESPAIAAEQRSIEYAITTAKDRIAAIAAADADAMERDKAGRALAMLDAFRKRGAELDAAFDRAIAEFGALERDFSALDLLGYAPTTWPAVRVSMRMAASTKLMFTDLQQDFLAPNKRPTFVATIEGWAQNVRSRATARLARNQKKAA